MNRFKMFGCRAHLPAQVYGPATIAADGTVLIGSQNGVLFALDPASGEPKWTFTDFLHLPMNSGPAIGSGESVF